MTESKKAKWTFGLAILGSVVSLATAAFSGYQWWNSQREAGIAAAIEISKNWEQDIELIERKRTIAILMIQIKPEESQKKRSEDSNYFRRLEYIAYLINHGRLHEDYLSASIKCDITVAPELIEGLKKLHAFPFTGSPEITKIASRYKDSCRTAGD
jgi:hypothetical protein